MSELHVSAWISALCLWPLGALCVVALMCKNYHDNWLQAIGLVGLALWAFGRASVLSERALDDGAVSAYQALSHVAMLLFALGTAIKVWRFRAESPAPRLRRGRALEVWRHDRGTGATPLHAGMDMVDRVIVAACIAIVLLVLSTRAEAQPYTASCEPKTASNPTASGSQKLEGWASRGAWQAWWCPAEAPAGAAPGKTWWKGYTWAGLYTYGWDKVPAAAARIYAAASPFEQAKIEIAAGTASAPAGSTDECEHKALLRAACVALRTPPYAGVPLDAITPDRVLSACGPVLNCAPVYTHAVKRNPSCTAADRSTCSRPVYTLVNGVRGTTEIGRAGEGTPCDLSKPTLASGSDVWASFGPAFEAGKVALCAK